MYFSRLVITICLFWYSVNEIRSEKVLRRKRRYLIFPKDSSLQLVYDSVVTIPDYTLYVLTGVTTALAWSLPDQPIYGDFEPLNQHNAQNRVDINVTEVTATPKPKPPTQNYESHKSHLAMNFLKAFYQNYRNKDRIHSPYVNSNYPYWKAISSHRYPYRPNSKSSYQIHPPFSMALDNADNYKRIEYSQAASSAGPEKPRPILSAESPRNVSMPPKKRFYKVHKIYPVIGKRSINNRRMTAEEKFYVDHHRAARYDLYGNIEKYLSAKGVNGKACVLKTLCEVGNKRSETEPGSFLGEIIRVIFSLPDAGHGHNIDKRFIHYDNAHRNTDDCAERFDDCPENIWKLGISLQMKRN